MGYGHLGVDFKSGGDASASASGFQSNYDAAGLVNVAEGTGVANPDIQTDEDLTAQRQNAEAGALGGAGGRDNSYQNLNV